MIDSQPKALVMVQADPSGNPRPRRIIELLKGNGFKVEVASFALAKPMNIDAHYEIKRPALQLHQKILRKLTGMAGLLIPVESFQTLLSDLRWGLKALGEKLLRQTYDLIVVEDIYLLPFAFRVKGNAKVIMDAREFYPEELGHSLFWSFTERPMRVRICRKYLKQCDAVMTVSEGLAQRYEKDFGIKPFLLRSMPRYQSFSPSPVQDGRVRMVHHGVANRDRRLENMIDIMNLLDSRFELDIYLTGDASYIEDLRQLASSNPKVRILDPVPFDQIVSMLNGYDMGFCYLPPTTFNLEYSLPNKFFEFIQGRLAVLIGPSPNMVPLVRDYHCGFITPSFDTKETAGFLNGLTVPAIAAAKNASHEAARILCYENESGELMETIYRLLGRPVTADQPNSLTHQSQRV